MKRHSGFVKQFVHLQNYQCLDSLVEFIKGTSIFIIDRNTIYTLIQFIQYTVPISLQVLFPKLSTCIKSFCLIAQIKKFHIELTRQTKSNVLIHA